MALILNIDTATEVAVVSIAEGEKVLEFITNSNQKDHASFLQPAIKKILADANVSIKQLNAVAVTAGPGSYTGLRVGMASAKGLCYALEIPMIAISSLEVIALTSINEIKNKAALYCPMIDARRMEVFTTVYNYNLEEKLAPCSMILDNDSFKELLQTHPICFSGSGSIKAKALLEDDHAIFLNNEIPPEAMAQLSYKKFSEKDFENVMYSVPLYIKEFHTISPSFKA